MLIEFRVVLPGVISISVSTKYISSIPITRLALARCGRQARGCQVLQIMGAGVRYPIRRLQTTAPSGDCGGRLIVHIPLSVGERQ